MAYRLMFDCEQLQTPLLDAQMALSKLRLCDLFWVAWTEFGGVGEGRRVSVILRKSDKFSQIPSHPGLDPADLRRDRVEKMRKKITI
jgi:hypothetical protein